MGVLVHNMCGSKGSGKSKIIIDRDAIINRELERSNPHIFLGKHVNDGIMNLGDSKREIMTKGLEKVERFSEAGLSKSVCCPIAKGVGRSKRFVLEIDI